MGISCNRVANLCATLGKIQNIKISPQFSLNFATFFDNFYVKCFEGYRHFQWTLRGEALPGKFPNLSGEQESSLHFCLESGEPEILHLGIKNGIFLITNLANFYFMGWKTPHDKLIIKIWITKNVEFGKLIKYCFWWRVCGAFSESSPLWICGEFLESFPETL